MIFKSLHRRLERRLLYLNQLQILQEILLLLQRPPNIIHVQIVSQERAVLFPLDIKLVNSLGVGNVGSIRDLFLLFGGIVHARPWSAAGFGFESVDFGTEMAIVPVLEEFVEVLVDCVAGGLVAVRALLFGFVLDLAFAPSSSS